MVNGETIKVAKIGGKGPTEAKGSSGKNQKKKKKLGGEAGETSAGCVPARTSANDPQPRTSQSQPTQKGSDVSRREGDRTAVAKKGSGNKAPAKGNKEKSGRDKEAPPPQKSTDKAKNGLGKTPKIGKPPRMPAVVITAPPGGYAEVMKEARTSINLQELGIQEVRPRKAVTGAMILEIPGDKEGSKADALAGRLSELLAFREGVNITRPHRRVDLRIRDLDDSISVEEIVEAIATLGACAKDLVKVGHIRRTAGGLGQGTAWIQCPILAARKITAQRRIKIGWLSYRVDVLQQRRVQCFKCLEAGHTSARCNSGTDRSQCCYRCGQAGHKSSECDRPAECPLCKEAGRKADHKIGSRGCNAKSGRKASAAPTRRGEGSGGAKPPSSSISQGPSGVQKSSPPGVAEAPKEKRPPRITSTSAGRGSEETPMEIGLEEAIAAPQCS